MDYITVQQAAEKWNISPRLAQQYCADGRIPGAQKFGTAWAIPASAQKPADPRKEKAASPSITAPLEEAPSHPIPMPLLNGPFLPGHCKEYVESIPEARLRDIAWAEYYYFSGQPEEAARIAELYLSYEELSLRLSACLIYTYANLSIGQIQRAKHTLTQIQNTLTAEETLPPQLQSVAVFAITTASVLLPPPCPRGFIPCRSTSACCLPACGCSPFMSRPTRLIWKGTTAKASALWKPPLPWRASGIPSRPFTSIWRR